MSFAKVYSAQTSLLKAHIINVEVDLAKGLYAFAVVGLPDKAVEESRDRISAAIKNSGFSSPKQKNQKVVISLAPADLKKEGPIFDVAMAMGYLLASEEISFNPDKKIFIGELSLDGSIRSVNGILPLIREAEKQGFTEAFVPRDNAVEAALIGNIAVYPVASLAELALHLNQTVEVEKRQVAGISRQPVTEISFVERINSIDFSDIKGQEVAKRGLEIAAAGGHNIAMYGPPGTGKTMLAKAFSGILPPLSFEEILEVTGIHSVAGHLKGDLIVEPPFRNPHHTSSYNALVGGGAVPKPGEITLAHRGVLFLDEFPEFERRVIDSLRQPLEDKVVSISRVRGAAHFPADFILIVAMNPCPCGNFGIAGKACTCTPIQIERYKRKLSGPIIDRIDIWVEVSQINHEALTEIGGDGYSSETIRTRIQKTREIQKTRFEKNNLLIKNNAGMGARELVSLVPLNNEVKKLATDAGKRLDLSARAFHRVIKLARTIADLAESEEIESDHLLEALQYRPKTKI